MTDTRILGKVLHLTHWLTLASLPEFNTDGLLRPSAKSIVTRQIMQPEQLATLFKNCECYYFCRLISNYLSRSNAVDSFVSPANVLAVAASSEATDIIKTNASECFWGCLQRFIAKCCCLNSSFQLSERLWNLLLYLSTFKRHATEAGTAKWQRLMEHPIHSNTYCLIFENLQPALCGEVLTVDRGACWRRE